MELLFLQPIFKERIWGGHKLKTNFGYALSSNQTGECWAISAHKNGETYIRNGIYAGMPLSQLWNEHPELFANNESREFPLMVKILDANDDLSVQVHPDDKFAQLIENDLGKAECWYVLDAAADAQIIYGHNAQSSDEFKQLATSGEWSKLLNYVPVKAGDFFDVPTGTVHALGKGTLILEVQQSSDTTYRLYDYDRRDAAGNLRELHLDKAFAVIKSPHTSAGAKPEERNIGLEATFTNLTINQHFQVGKLEVNGKLELTLSVPYLLVSVVSGEAILNGQTIKKGDHLIVPNQMRKLNFNGYVSLIICNEVTRKS
ncbi:MAG: class I mannose-6-phosphate isomerase [Neisseriales bacterium]|nr:MAG: class I mannose-6-phosphate isomerase [Neisseriales bacterium]HRG63400.1 class I mannose-6-phosphate isomerase [Burkholderiales bacterium]